MDWVKQNYERALLALAAVALLACSVLVILKAQAFPTLFEGRNSTKPQDNTIKPYPREALQTAASQVANPVVFSNPEGSLLVSLPYVLKEITDASGNVTRTLINPMESPEPLHPPIKNTWLIHHNLPWWERDVKDQDPDEDHFSNLEEFENDTDPKDRTSVPPYWKKLRLKEFISKPFRLKFNGTPDEGQTFQINPQGGRTQFRAIGEMIEGTPYKVVAHEKKSEKRNEIDVDISELTIENTETGKSLVLVYRKEANDPTSFAKFLFLYDNSEFTVKKDDEFSLSPQPDLKYKLIDINDEKAVIQDQKTKEEHHIPRLQ
jgi:hypothetical protein